MISEYEELPGRGRCRLLPQPETLIGGFACAAAALGACALASGHSWQTDVPLVFTVILLLVAVVCGLRAGVLGTVLSALVFALFLFAPVGTIHVANDAARINLGWMLMIGIAFSFLFAPPRSGLRRR